MAPPVKNCAQQGVYAPDAAPYDFYRGTEVAVISSCTFLIGKLSDCARAITGAQLLAYPTRKFRHDPATNA